MSARAAPLVAQLEAYLGPQAASTAPEARAAGAAAGNWLISLRFGPDVLRNGMDPLAFLQYLARLGRISDVAASFDGMPAGEAMDAETCYLGLDLAFSGDATEADIENVFEFVRDDCAIRIKAVPTVRAEPGATAVQAAAGGDAKVQERRSIRVDADKLDHLIDLVGELIIAGARSALLARGLGSSELLESTSLLSGLVADVRDSALQLRMVKIGATFNRFQRVVHDVAREIGKDIELQVNGEDTELDKTVVEQIGDPLTHLVRNAIDHGIESTELRRQRGKSERGTVWLNAYHDSGSIVIEVSDDGGGLDRDRILAKAEERGLVEPGRDWSDAEIFNLIFEPGFSTAAQVTSLSGRGVGMDVVKRNITAMRGSVGVASQAGVGTTVTVRLPLTLAIIDGFQVGIGTSVFVVPLDTIEECVEFSAEPGHDYTNLRGQVMPLIRLRELFAIKAPPTRRESIVVIRHGGQRAGLVVDTLLGESQTVIKPLSSVFSQIKCISGSTILGSGEVALILDMAAMLDTAVHRGRKPVESDPARLHAIA